MRIIIFLLVMFIIIKPVEAQTPSKSQMQSQMKEAINDLNKQIADTEKQLADAKKNKEDAETIKDLEEQLKMLKKQVDMMGGLNKNLANMSDKIVQQATEEDPIVPKKDAVRINSLPKKIMTETELSLFIKNVNTGVEKLIPAAERTEALNIYNQTKSHYKSTAVVANAANGCWMIGHWEKALFIMGKACMDDMRDADNLNNYAAFLIMTGGEQAALPILEYLNEKYPDNSTILNNIGQAWFGLGDLDNAKKYLDETKILYPNHSMANNTLANIYEVAGDNEMSISFLKASLKENYDPEKEAQLRRLGYEIKFADMPPLNYPMKNDPFGFIPLINSWDPNKIQSSIADGETALALQRYIKGVKDFQNELNDEDAELQRHLEAMLKRIAADKTFSQELLKPYDCPAYLVASRSLQLYCMEKAGRCLKKPRSASPLITGLWLPVQEPIVDNAIFQPLLDLIADCEQLWFKEVMEPLAMLDKALTSNANPNMNCKDVDAKWDAYLAKEKELYSNGVKAIQAEFQKQSPAVTNYIKYAMYSGIDEQDESASKSTDDFILDNVWIIGEIDRSYNRKRIRNKYYQSINSLLLKGDRFKKRYKSTCNTEPDAELIPGDEDLVRYKVKTLECEYIKKVITPVRYKFVLHCNNITEETDPNLPKRKPDNQKGSAHNASRKNSTKGPVRSPRGPHFPFDVNEDAEANYGKAPLTSENKDISQFSLEYNKWGNLVGFNFQLNEDGSGLKDPNSIESGVDSRWSWNAIASAKKGHMNKLLIK